MPAVPRTAWMCLCALASLACTAIIEGNDRRPVIDNAAGGPAAEVPTSPACADAGLVPARVRKVTDRHYAQLLAELLPGVEPHVIATPGSELALIKDAETFVVRGPLASQYWDSAASIAAQAVQSLSTLAPCSPLPTEQVEQRQCAEQLIGAFGRKAFRRPLVEADVAPLLSVYDVGAETSFAKGVELMVAAVLQSADFLYRTELGDGTGDASEVALGAYEVASLLSFAFLGGAPDAELYRAAESGELSGEPGVAVQVERLLQLPAVQGRVTELVSNVLGADGALTSQRDAREFPELTLPLRQAMADEVHELVQSNIFGLEPLGELFTSRAAKVDDALAAFYGVNHAGAPSIVQLPAQQRSGILSRGATLLSLPTGSRAVHRGLFIAHNYLCRVLAPPPASLQGEIAQTLALGLNERQTAELRASKPACAGCHSSFDSLGLAFEHYDFVGKYLTERDGAPVDASGTLNHSDVDGPFADAVELGEILARSKDVAQCLPQRLSAQVLGLVLDEREKCAVQQLIEPWTSGPRQLGALVPLLANSRLFLRRARVD